MFEGMASIRDGRAETWNRLWLTIGPILRYAFLQQLGLASAVRVPPTKRSERLPTATSRFESETREGDGPARSGSMKAATWAGRLV